MIRNLKALGLALVAALALSAMAASAAQGKDPGTVTSQSGTYPLFLDGTGTNAEKFTAFGSQVTCNHGDFKSTPIPGPAHEVLVTPVYTGCHAEIAGLGVLPATVTHNKCEYRFHHATTHKASVQHQNPLEITHFYTLTTDIVNCDPLKPRIEVHVYKDHIDHTAGKSLCTLTVKQQTGLTGVTADVKTVAGDVTLTGTVEGVHTEQHRESALCPAGTTTTNGIYHIPPAGVTVTGTDELAKPSKFHIG